MTAGRPGEGDGQSSRPPKGRSRQGEATTLAGTLEAAEAAAPVESLDVVARILKERLGQRRSPS